MKVMTTASGFLALVLATACLTASAGEATFTAKPATTKAGDTVKISFAVTAPTDVEVAVLDSAGKVVRHLAAGALGGPKPPPEPLKAGLSQTLEWDGKDDFGKAAAGGPFKVRVGLGLKPVFDKFLFNDRQALLDLHGLATGPDGRLYTRGSDYDGGWGIGTDVRAFSPDGQYVQTLAPFPAGLPFERVAPFGAIRVNEKEYLPYMYALSDYGTYPANFAMSYTEDSQMAVSDDGLLFLTGKSGSQKAGCPFAGENSGPYICVLDGQGGVPAGWSFLGKGIQPSQPKGFRFPSLMYLAISSDGKRIYVGGAHVENQNSVPAVYWTDLKERGPLQVLCGDPAKAGDAEGLLKNPQGLAADGKGHLLVADSGNNRIAVFSEADGKAVASFPVPAPCKVQVDRKTGAVYVLTHDKAAKGKSDLIKFSDWKEHKEVCRLALPPGGAGMSPMLAVSGGEKPVAWVADQTGRYRPYKLLRIPDLGQKFGDPVNVCPEKGKLIEDLSVDRKGNEVWFRRNEDYWHFKDGEEKAEKIPCGAFLGVQLQAGPDCNIYGYGYAAALNRWDKTGKPVPFPAKPGANSSTFPFAATTIYGQRQEAHILGIPVPMNYQANSMFIDQGKGEIYVIQPPIKRELEKPPTVMRVYDLDGNLKREPITRLNERAAGPRVDLQGNIYVAECGRPNSPALPEFFNGKVPEIKEKELEKVPTAANSYSWGYGSIVKFSPQGGEIAWPMTMWANAAYEAKANYKKWQGNVPGSMEFDFYGPRGPQQMAKAPVKGALWVHMGAYPVAAHANTCACMGYTFDVDYYGRSFYPEAARSRVGILDSNGNEIGFFGRYGNRDDARSDGTTPLAMPIAAAVTDRFVYVGDVNNQCLARVKLTHAAEETCDVK